MEIDKLEYFDSKKIKKYWRNQIPPKDLSNKFIDPYFPINESSILGLDQNGNWIDPINGPVKSKSIDCSRIEWKSVSEIMGKFLLFDSKIECDDIKQGNLGNCYFLSAIAALTEMPQLIYQIFITKKENMEGYYEIVLFLDGEWQIVFVDDYLPVEKGTNNLIFSKPNGSELWAVLLEKAWAKVNGGYILTISGWPSDPLTAFTGFTCEKILHKEYNIDDIWNLVLISDKNDNIMCTSTKNDGTVEKSGLVVNHAYTLIGAKEINYNNERIRLVRIRNPWGNKEWNGDWSDQSLLWNDELRKNFNCINAIDDGTFYMSIEDFIKYYDSTHICHIMYHSFMKSKFLANNNLKHPIVYNMYIDRECITSISLIFRHWRFNRELLNKNHPSTIIVAKYDENFLISNVDGVYSSIDSLEFVRSFKKGFYGIWIFVCLEKSDIDVDQAILRCCSLSPFKLIYVNEDIQFNIAKKFLLEGIKEKDAEKFKVTPSFYKAIENQFKKCGLGFCAVYNKNPESYLKLDFDTSKIQSAFILPPFSNKENFLMIVPPKEERIVLGIKEKSYCSYWFNLQMKYSVLNGKVPIDTKSDNITTIFLQDYLRRDFKTEVIHYDYMTISSEQSKIIKHFEHIDVTFYNLENLYKENPDMIKLIFLCHPLIDDKSLKWNKSTYDSGYYMGQINKDNKREGRGAFIWNDGTYYVGYWEDGLKRAGKFYYPDGTMFYNGEFQNGVKHGEGIQYFRDGTKYEGEFAYDKKNGKGTFYWTDGSHWKGNFLDGVSHGKGLFYLTNENPLEIEYDNGKIIK